MPTLVAKRYELAASAHDDAAAARFKAQLVGGTPDQRLALVAAEERLEQFQEALSLIDQALAAEPTSPELRFRKATLLERVGKFDESVGLFQGLIAADPEHGPALNYLGYMQIERGVEVEAGTWPW